MSHAEVALDDASKQDVQELAERLTRWNREQVGPERVKDVFLALRCEGQLRGGMISFTSWNVLVIDIVWVDTELRGKGHGRRLLAETERRAKALGCDRATLETFSWQAQPFYESAGYKVAGQVDDHPRGQSRVVMVKSL